MYSNITLLNKTYVKNSKLTYVINLYNNGKKTISNININDDLGKFNLNGKIIYPLNYINNSIKVFINGVANTNNKVNYDKELTISNITLNDKEVATILYQTEINEYAPLNANDFIKINIEIDYLGINKKNKLTEVIKCENYQDIEVVKNIISENSNDSYNVTYIILNYGNKEVEKEDQTNLSDIFNPIIKGIKVELNDLILTPNNYLYNQINGSFSINKGVISVPKASYIVDDKGKVKINPGKTIIKIIGKL